MKTINLVFFMVLASFSMINAQESKPKAIKTKKTQKHQNVSNTQLYLNIPIEYTPSLTFVGWNKNNDALIIVSKKSQSLNDAFIDVELKFKINGFDISSIEKKDFLINGKRAVFFETINNETNKMVLLIHQNGITYIIEGISNNIDTKELKKSILTAFIEE